MFRRQVTIERQPRAKNGAPPHRTTGVASASSSQTSHGAANAWRSAGSIPAISMTSSGAARAALTQNRRRMSTSSGLGPSSTATVRGSRAMPQIGHSPGAGRTISGCIGQTYSVRETGRGDAGSSAMPHTGQAPGAVSWTSGSIGQMYSMAPAAGVGAAGAAAAGACGRCIPCVPGAARMAAGPASKRSAQRGPQK